MLDTVNERRGFMFKEHQKVCQIDIHGYNKYSIILYKFQLFFPNFFSITTCNFSDADTGLTHSVISRDNVTFYVVANHSNICLLKCAYQTCIKSIETQIKLCFCVLLYHLTAGVNESYVSLKGVL